MSSTGWRRYRASSNWKRTHPPGAFCLPERMVVGPRGWEPRPLEVLNGGVEVGLPVPQCPHEVPGEELLNEEVLQSPNVVAVVVQVATGPVAIPDVSVYEHDVG